MKIQGDGNIPREIGRIARNELSQPTERTAPNVFHRQDVVELSSTRLELAGLVEQVRNAPDVRMDRVEALRQALADGSYQVDATALADRLIDHMLGLRV